MESFGCDEEKRCKGNLRWGHIRGAQAFQEGRRVFTGFTRAPSETHAKKMMSAQIGASCERMVENRYVRGI